MANIHDQARKFLAGDGIALTDTQKKAVFLFADFVSQQKRQPTKRAPDADLCPACGDVLSENTECRYGVPHIRAGKA